MFGKWSLGKRDDVSLRGDVIHLRLFGPFLLPTAEGASDFTGLQASRVVRRGGRGAEFTSSKCSGPDSFSSFTVDHNSGAQLGLDIDIDER